LCNPPVRFAEFGLSPIQNLPPSGAHAPAGAVDFEIQHRHRGLEWRGFAPLAPVCGPLQRLRDLPGASHFEDARLEIERIASFRDLG
jgi:hypothetical protein